MEPIAETLALAIAGMACSGCAGSVTRALSRVPGVRRAEVDLATGCARVEGSAAAATLIAAVEDAGYGARLLPPG